MSKYLNISMQNSILEIIENENFTELWELVKFAKDNLSDDTHRYITNHAKFFNFCLKSRKRLLNKDKVISKNEAPLIKQKGAIDNIKNALDDFD